MHNRFVKRWFGPAVFFLALQLSAMHASMAHARVLESQVETDLVRGPVDFTVIVPDDYFEQKTVYPLILFLHDRDGGSGYLNGFAPIVHRLWRDGLTSPCVIVAPDCRQSQFLDYQDGSQRWESFLLNEFLPYVQQTFRVALRKEKTIVGGFGEGAAAALRLTFKNPETFGATLALQPFVLPALRWRDVKPEDNFWYSIGYLKIRYGDPISAEHWNGNNPAYLVQRNRQVLAKESPSIFLECGLSNSYGLHRGTEFLHQELVKAGIPHEYRMLLGVDHAGRGLDGRLADALLFLEGRLNPPPPDPALDPLHKKTHDLRRAAGLDK